MKRLRDIFPLLVVLVGLAIMAYPTISNFLVERNASRVVSAYQEAVDALSDEDAQAMLDAAWAYNARLAGLAGISAADGGADAGTVSSTQLREQYNQLLNLNGDGVMGYITIPRLDETLPIYHGTDEATLQVGVGHIDTSSLPVGGASTHAALSGHRGLPSAKLFTDLDRMKKGDIFFVRVLKSTFAYQVDQIETVLPDQTESLNITAGDDYLTLVTCTPYGINSHRLLVRGHAIPYTADMESQVGVSGNPINIPLPYLALMIALAVLAVLLASLLIGRAIEARRDAAHAAAGSRVAGARQAGSSCDAAGTGETSVVTRPGGSGHGARGAHAGRGMHGAHEIHDSTRRGGHGGKHMR